MRKILLLMFILFLLSSSGFPVNKNFPKNRNDFSLKYLTGLEIGMGFSKFTKYVGSLQKKYVNNILVDCDELEYGVDEFSCTVVFYKIYVYNFDSTFKLTSYTANIGVEKKSIIDVAVIGKMNNFPSFLNKIKINAFKIDSLEVHSYKVEYNKYSKFIMVYHPLDSNIILHFF